VPIASRLPGMNDTGGSRGRAAGFQDWVGAAAARRRAVADAFLDSFARWGYDYMATPLVEPLETVAAGVAPAQQAQLFRFMDGDGSLLALVGERTVSAARVVATQLQHGPFPMRLCYAGPVLRNQTALGGRRREALQAGCELIGHRGLAADAECIAVAADALRNAGISGVQIDAGHADFIPALLGSAGLDAAQRAEVGAALRRRDLVAVEAALEGTAVAAAERALLLDFPTLRGGREILDTASERLQASPAHEVLDELRSLWTLLEEHGVTGSVHLDLGAAPDWDYYTGVTFELFSSELGFPLGSGGRYDRLLSAFGLDSAATGFVLHVDRCVDALLRREQPEAVPPLRVTWSSEQSASARRIARTLRDAGLGARCDLDPLAGAPSQGDAIHVDGDGSLTWSLLGRSGAGTIEAAIALLRDGRG
jgi:ATP phosphoribosyltransferase regulatory subunit